MPGARRTFTSHSSVPDCSRASSRRCIFREILCCRSIRFLTALPMKTRASACSHSSTGPQRCPVTRSDIISILFSAAAWLRPSRYMRERLRTIRKIEMTTPPASSQTVGPFFHLGMVYLERDNFVAEGVAGERITIRGKVLDGDGEPVPDAVLEIWQADSAGRYPGEFSPPNSASPRFLGFGRIETG